MTEVKYGTQSVQFNKRGHTNAADYEEVDFASWSLKKQLNELSTLDVELLYPGEWINEDSETGLKCTVGDELHLYASFGSELGDDTKRFGGYITSITGHYGDGVGTLSLTASDYRLALKNKIVFKDTYYIAPDLMSTIARNVGVVTESNCLYDGVVAACTLSGITDFSLMEKPYIFMLNGAAPLRRWGGTYSSNTIKSKFGVGGTFQLGAGSNKASATSYQFYTDTRDSYAEWEIYNGSFDLMDYPHFAYYLYYPKACKAAWGYKFVINGQNYFLPYSSSLSTLGDIHFPRRTIAKQSSWRQEIIDIREMMDASYTDTSYNCTYIGLVAQPAASGTGGVFYLDMINMMDNNQNNKKVETYNYEDSMALVNDICKQCNHIFKINPYKQPTITSQEECISNMSVIEGENLITADSKFDDSQLINNKVAMANINQTKIITGMAIDERGIAANGEYCNVEETTDYTTADTVKQYAIDQVKQGGWLKPSVSVNVSPSFEYEEGDITYVYIPSIGIEKSLEINSVNLSSDGACSLELGQPETTLALYLKRLQQNQKHIQTTAMTSANMIPAASVDAQFKTPKRTDDGLVILTGTHMYDAGVDIMNGRYGEEILSMGLPAKIGSIDVLGAKMWTPGWLGENMGEPTALAQTEDGIWAQWTDFCSFGWAVSIPIGAENHSGIKNVRIYMNWQYTPITAAYFEVYAFSKFSIYGLVDPNNVATQNCQLNTGDIGDGFGNYDGKAYIDVPMTNVPDLPYYILYFSFNFGAYNNYQSNSCLITRIDISYGTV
jgi:hypothetical protein